MYYQKGRALGRYFQRKRKLQILNNSQAGEERSGEGKCWDSLLGLVSDNRIKLALENIFSVLLCPQVFYLTSGVHARSLMG